MGGRGVHSEFKEGNLKERDDWEDLEADYDLILQSKLK
jgi:hypothetical protein